MSEIPATARLEFRLLLPDIMNYSEVALITDCFKVENLKLKIQFETLSLELAKRRSLFDFS